MGQLADGLLERLVRGAQTLGELGVVGQALEAHQPGRVANAERAHAAYVELDLVRVRDRVRDRARDRVRVSVSVAYAARSASSSGSADAPLADEEPARAGI